MAPQELLIATMLSQYGALAADTQRTVLDGSLGFPIVYLGCPQPPAPAPSIILGDARIREHTTFLLRHDDRMTSFSLPTNNAVEAKSDAVAITSDAVDHKHAGRQMTVFQNSDQAYLESIVRNANDWCSHSMTKPQLRQYILSSLDFYVK